MEAINNKKRINQVCVFRPNEALETCNYPEYVLHLQKER